MVRERSSLPRSTSRGTGYTGSGANGYGGSSRNDDLTDDYYNSLFMGTSYESQYLAIMNKYRNGAPSSLFGSLTGKNETNAYNHQMKMYDELSALATKMYDEEYQSPTAETQRLRSAGLNPDLTGLTGAAAPVMQSQGTPANVAAENPLVVTSRVLEFAISTYRSIQGFKSISLDNEKKSLDNLVKMMDTARPSIVQNFADLMKKDSKGGDNWADLMQIYNPYKRGSQSYKRFMKAYSMELSSGNYTAARSALDQLRGVEDGRMSYGQVVGSKHWSPDDKALYDFVGGMMDLQIAMEESQAKANKTRFDYDRSYYDNLDGAKMAEYDQSIKGSESAEKYINRYRRKVYDMLYYDYKNGSMLAGLMIVGMNNAMNIGSQMITGASQWLDKNVADF